MQLVLICKIRMSRETAFHFAQEWGYFWQLLVSHCWNFCLRLFLYLFDRCRSRSGGFFFNWIFHSAMFRIDVSRWCSMSKVHWKTSFSYRCQLDFWCLFGDCRENSGRRTCLLPSWSPPIVLRWTIPGCRFSVPLQVPFDPGVLLSIQTSIHFETTFFW